MPLLPCLAPCWASQLWPPSRNPRPAWRMEPRQACFWLNFWLPIFEPKLNGVFKLGVVEWFWPVLVLILLWFSGLASLTTGACFLLAIPIAPVVSAVPPLASGPILCLLGALMCSSVRGIDWDDFEESMPAFLAMVTMPYTFSIGYGIIAGLLLWSLDLDLDKFAKIDDS